MQVLSKFRVILLGKNKPIVRKGFASLLEHS
jgi:hypothetical protein